MAKRVILHIGFHKTGSSALQVFLATNADRLAAAGIGYPYPDPEHIVATGGCSGNAVQVLYRGGFMDGIKVGENVESRLTEAYFETLAGVIVAVPQHTALVSSEILSVNAKENMTNFIERLRSFHDVEVVCFVRDPFDFVFSCWRQKFKNSPNAPSFSNFIDEVLDDKKKSLSMLGSFDFFHSLDLPLAVLNFDHHRSDIAASFLRSIGAISLIDQVEVTTAREANRSLTPSEACLAILVNEKINNANFSATFLRAALSREKPKSREYYNRELHQRILDRFASTIALINGHLPDDQKLATEVRNRPDADFVIVPEDVALLLELVEKLVTARIEPRGSASAGNFTTSVVLPADFDPEAYLFHNPDVAAAKADATAHYLLHGWREGRRYRFF